MERLGVGGFASVWLYRDDELQSDVAVKALADNWAQRLDIRDRFLQEARILRRADSDYVVRVYDVGEVEGTPYFVMSYADRGTVSNLIERKGSISLARTLSVVTQAGAGLSVLHAQGSIHRDIKPANLLLRTDGPGTRVMVADLGVAKAMLHASGLTHVVGTPAYMAPEQAMGGGVDERADVYALAAVELPAAHREGGAHRHDRGAGRPRAAGSAVRAGRAPSRSRRGGAPRVGAGPRGALARRAVVRRRLPGDGTGAGAHAPGQPPSQGRVATRGEVPAGSRLLFALVCLAVFLACFGGALVATQQLR